MNKTEQAKKFRGVRQRHWGSWVSEIRHPLLKKRVWLGTFETAEAAARAYDEAAVLMNGRNAKTNFPGAGAGAGVPALSEILHAKLRKGGKTPFSRPVTCLRLDTESCNIGVWQKSGSGGAPAGGWPVNTNGAGEFSRGNDLERDFSARLVAEGEGFGVLEDDQDSLALQMIDELLLT